MGVFSLVFSMYQYKMIVKRLGGRQFYTHPSMIAGASILLLGIVLLMIIVMNLKVF